MPEWSTIVTDGRNGFGLVDSAAPYTNMKWSDGLDAGNLTCSFPLDAVPAFDRINYIDIDRTVIWPTLDGNPVGAWIVTSRPPRALGADTVELVAQPALWRILGGRTVRSTLVFKQQNQLNIARDLIRYALGRTTQHTSAPQPFTKGSTYDAPWITLGTNISSQPPRDRLDNSDGWQAAGRKKLSDCLRSLIELEDGFEVSTTASLGAGGLPVLKVNFGDPFLGYVADPVDEPGLLPTLEWPSAAVTAGQHGTDGSERASLVDTISSGSADPANQLIASAVNLADQSLRMPRELAQSAANVTVMATLQAKSNDTLAVDGPSVEGFSLTVGSDPPLVPYSFPWGMWFRLVIDDDLLFPPRADGSPASYVVRCRGASFDVGGFGAADTVQLSLEVWG